MTDFLDILEACMHTMYTWAAVVLSYWEPICAFILMAMQGVYLFYKIKHKRGECKADSEEDE